MPDKNIIIKKPETIFDLIQKSCAAKLDIRLQAKKNDGTEKVYSSYFIGFEKERYLAIMDRLPRGKAYYIGQELQLRFSIIHDGILYEFLIETKYKSKEEYKFFPILVLEYPDQIVSFEYNDKYKIVPPELDPVEFNLIVDDEIIPQNVIKYGINDLQFYFSDSEKSMKKFFFLGKRLDVCELIIRGKKMEISAVINGYEAGTIIVHVTSFKEENLPDAKQYMQDVYLETALKTRFGWDHVTDSPIQQKRILGRKKILVIESDKDMNLSIKEFLNQKGYYTTCIMEECNILLNSTALKPDVIIINTELEWGSGLEIGRELQKNKITKKIPIIYISDLGTKVKMSSVLDAGGVEFLIHPFSLKKLLKKVYVAILLRNQEHVEEETKILLLDKDNRRLAYLTAEWADNRSYQIIYGSKIGEFPRTVIRKSVSAVIINSRGGLEKYILETCNKLHDYEYGRNIPVFIVNPQVFSKNVVVLKKMIYGINYISDESLNFIETVITGNQLQKEKSVKLDEKI